MSAQPVEDTDGLVHFTQGSLVYAGRHLHQDGYPVHTHSFLEIAVVLGGRGTHHSMAGGLDLSRGDAVVLRPGVWHEYRDCSGLLLFNCCFSVDLLTNELAWMRQDPLLGHALLTGPHTRGRHGVLRARLDEDALAGCLPHLQGLADLHSQPLTRHRGDLIGHLVLFLSGLARAAEEEAESSPFDSTHRAVVAAMQLFDERLAHPWRLDELSRELHLAPGSLVRLFRSAVGMPPMAYLARQRAEAAATMLLATDLAVTEIGRSVGWADPNYFARRFRAHLGLNATEYRRRFRVDAGGITDRLRPTRR